MELVFNDAILKSLDISISKRHSSKYYGVEFSFEEAKEEVEFLSKLFKDLIKFVK